MPLRGEGGDVLEGCFQSCDRAKEFLIEELTKGSVRT
jgi:hypothetical protein